ncbi:endo-1,4-beta-xylanase [Pedobacter sp.]|uniref:endo-1,4-beta-xylanase n=1 Tax=Pedobacter sp. TaxID=1411316 RepID=UPI0031D32764
MRKKTTTLISLALVAIITSSLSSFTKPTKGLKDYYKKYFPIGVAISSHDMTGENSELITREFNSITAENSMKMGPIHPFENVYDWKVPDSMASFARKNNLKFRGHCLVWHTQAPHWLYKDKEGKTATKQLLLERLKSHIHTVVNRYKNDIYAWDVVNEVIADDTSFYRKSPLYEIAGEDFIEMAFRYAHQAAPKARLFYNDYNTEQPHKREKIYKMVKGLLAKGVPIHGVGLQGHWSINDPSRAEIEKSISLFADLGLEIQITELDVSVYSGAEGGRIIRGKERKEVEPFTAEMEEKQLQQYKMIFEVFRKYKKNITGVTFWNLSDRASWLDGRGRKNYPLLFDKNLKPKKVYYEVINFKK